MGKKLRIAIPALPENTVNYRNALEQLNAVGVCGDDFDPAEFDGLLLPGGTDIEPSIYGCENCGSEEIDEALDRIQLATMDRFVKAGKPILGICKGLQVINVYFGGTLIQHIPVWPQHRRIEGKDNAHMTRAEAGSFLEKLYGMEFVTNSAHHQAADRIGKGLKIIQFSGDGIVEALCNEEMNIYALQWHPERMCFANKREDTVDGSLVIQYFLDKCKT